MIVKVSNFEAGIPTFDVSDFFLNFMILKYYCDSTPLFGEVSYRLDNVRTFEFLCLTLQIYDHEIILKNYCEAGLQLFNEMLMLKFKICSPLQTNVLDKKYFTKPWKEYTSRRIIKKNQSYYKLLKQQRMSCHKLIVLRISSRMKSIYEKILQP